MINLVINFDQEADKKRLWAVMRLLKGLNSVEIKKFRTKRPTKYYFKHIVIPLSTAFGWSQDETHEFLKRTFNPVLKPNQITGEEVLFGGTTSKFTKEQANDYYTRICDWAMAEYSILLTKP
jgi:hypothetical protein